MRSPLILPVLLFSVMTVSVACQAQKKANTVKSKPLLQTIAANFEDGAKQYKALKATLPPDRFPKTFYPQTGKSETSGSGWWCSGFYPGTLLYLYEQTGDTVLYNEAERILGVLQKEQYNKTTHDLGFMMFCSFGNANRIQPKAAYNEILLNSAKSLCSRFNEKTGCIKSWDSKDPSDFLVIIDNMMNLELLFETTKATGDSSYYKIAVTHANTTLQNHFRADNSSYHVLNYDVNTGAVKQKKTAQGAADASAWARGQAWGLYGYTVCYRYTKDARYLQQAEKIARFILSHPNLPADKIPYWDFNAPEIPNALRDASAAAIMAAAFIELNQYTKGAAAREYLQVAETIIKHLSGPEYKAAAGTNGGFILKHGVGHKPAGTEVDVPLTYGDYYFIEACKRYKELSK
ncbi:glycoside hydrolase family 88 protein [Longitalea arenae]|uniref:glycoside hydrolase family 88 protein n=1 Tax=Longitalea arenae TaxID=2812558 RepID=UPI0019673096|nr:glycoside hydrolase family 88 protein [Longitalea arenae]